MKGNENSIETVNDIMKAIQEETQAARDGTMDLQLYRLTLQGRRQQLRGFEIGLQAMRLFSKTKFDIPKSAVRLFLPAAASEEEKAKTA